MVDGIVRFCTRYMSVGVVLIGFLGILEPGLMKPLAPQIPTFLGIIMFGMGMSLTPDDFRNVFRQPKTWPSGPCSNSPLCPPWLSG